MNYDVLIADLERIEQEISGIWNTITDDNTINHDEPPIDPGYCLDILEMISRQKQEILYSDKYKKWREEHFYG